MASSKKDKTDLTRLDQIHEFEHQDDDELTVHFELPQDESISTDEPASTPEEENNDSDEQNEELSIPEFEIDEASEQVEEEVNLLDLDEHNIEQESDELEADDLNLEPDPEEQLDVELTENQETTELNDQSDKVWPQHIPQESAPNFTLKITGLQRAEDKEDIEIILKEFKIINQENQEHYQRFIANGHILIPRIGEFLAIRLAHQLRRFPVELSLGLSDDLTSSNELDQPIGGHLTPQSMKLNRKQSADFSNVKMSLDDILLSNTSQLENYKVRDYLGIAIEVRKIAHKDFSYPNEEQFIAIKNKELKEISFKRPEIQKLYQEMALALRPQALELGANGVINISYQVSSLQAPDEGNQIQITCTGNIVILSEKQ